MPATGRFGHGWAIWPKGLRRRDQLIDFRPLGAHGPEPGGTLQADERRIKAVIATHVDTSSSVLNDMAACAAIDAVGHPALLMADCIASMGCDRFEMDAWGVDVAVTASQKGLMVPPGWASSSTNARPEVRRAMPQVSRYWDWAPRAKARDLLSSISTARRRRITSSACAPRST
ncbi:MAG: hypothetical protein R3D85_03850 [Paracoccaceae bacterium]